MSETSGHLDKLKATLADDTQDGKITDDGLIKKLHDQENKDARELVWDQNGSLKLYLKNSENEQDKAEFTELCTSILANQDNKELLKDVVKLALNDFSKSTISSLAEPQKTKRQRLQSLVMIASLYLWLTKEKPRNAKNDPGTFSDVQKFVDNGLEKIIGVETPKKEVVLGTVEPEPVEPEPVEPEPVEPVEPEPVEPEPVEPEPVEPEPVEPEPVEPEPVEPEPVEPDPVEPDPVEPEPVKPETKAEDIFIEKMTTFMESMDVERKKFYGNKDASGKLFFCDQSKIDALNNKVTETKDSDGKKQIKFEKCISSIDGKRQYKMTWSNEVWYVALGVWTTQQYPNGADNASYGYTLWKESKEQIHGGGIESLDEQTLINKIKSIKSNYDNQEEKALTLSGIDLPKDKKIGYIPLTGYKHNMASDDDLLVDNSIPHSENFPLLMRRAGYDFAKPDGSHEGFANLRAVLDTKTPLDIIKDGIQAGVNNGITNFFLNLDAHGNESGIYFFDSKGKYNKLAWSDLVDVLNMYPTCTFTINSIACNGGGFRAEDKNGGYLAGLDDAMKEKVTVLLQTKPDEGNEEGRDTKNNPESTYFNMFLDRAVSNMGKKLLLPGDVKAGFPGWEKNKSITTNTSNSMDIKAFGDCIRYADLWQNAYIYSNAEVVKKDFLYTMSEDKDAIEKIAATA